MTETEGTFDGSPGSSIEESVDDGRAVLTIERRMQIVKTINMHKTATVAEIVEWLGASPATVRRDLAWLDEQGLITRTRGGATAINYPSQAILRRTVPAYEQRLNEYVEEKQSIGRSAAENIHDGETIILDPSSTNHYMLPFLAKKRDLTVITNSLYISKELMTIVETNPSLTVICSGGTLFMRSYSFIGMIAEQALSQFYVDKAFIGLRGISLHHGLTSPFPEEIPVKRQMIKCAQQVFILADHTKFNLTFASLIAPLNIVHTLITDARIPPEVARQMSGAIPHVIIAPLIEIASPENVL
ncbi:MAG TPA: DeoR/GlpR family DNA-binding transcription regulator [Ktedonobacteraceae bacterium]|nr:DeoR/GlpR family DNA-binding transcription regulator [Ktedonobacteraceae bacterium]